MTEERLQEIRDLLKGVTPLPWKWSQIDEGEEDGDLYGPPHPVQSESQAIIVTDCGYYPPKGATRRFLGESRAIVEELLEHIEETARGVEECREDMREAFGRME